MTITKRTVSTHSADINGRIQVKEYAQVIETMQDEGGNDVERIIESIPHTGVIDPTHGDYDAKVKALGERLTGQLAASQESKIRNIEKQRDDKTGECVEHEKRIATLEKVIQAQESKIQELQSSIPEKEILDVRR